MTVLCWWLQVGRQRQVLLDVGADGGGALGSMENAEDGGEEHEDGEEGGSGLEDEEMVDNGGRCAAGGESFIAAANAQ